ncbi:hypothetical protein AAOE16_04840 [Ekhidna sp. MALMAid0563]|uniref:PKD domain-containing protein n=1 Tax=Ekhidna sp. MALMAid0563 TaxID=3143937 RepID=UPI0032E01CE7
MNRSIFFIGTVFLCLFISCKDDDQAEKVEPEACFDFRSGPYYTGDSIKFTNCSSNAESYQWDLNGDLISDEIDFTFTPNNPGEFKVKLSVERDGKKDTISQTFEVEDYNGFVLDKSSPEQSASPRSMIKLADGGILISYVSFNHPNANTYYHLVKVLESEVDWHWNRRYGANLYESTLYENEIGNIQFTQNNWISGFSETLVETFAASGQNINSRTIEDNENGLIDFMIDGDSIIYVGYSGPRYDYNLFIHITDHQGMILDSKLIAFDEIRFTGKSIRRNNEGYLILGWSNVDTSSDEVPKVNLLQLDDDFSKLWIKSYEINGIDAWGGNGSKYKWEFISNDEDGGLVVFSYPTVLKLDQERNKVWSYNYRSANKSYQGLTVGDAIKVGDEFIFGFDNNIIKIDQDGNEIWRKKIPTGTVVQLLKETDHFVILENRESKYVSEEVDGDLPAYQVSLIKMDFDGNYLDF